MLGGTSRRGIFVKLFSTMLLLSIVLGAVILSVVLRDVRQSIENNLIQGNRRLAEVAARSIESGYIEHMFPFRTLSQIKESEDVLFWWIVKPDGVIYLADDPSMQGKGIELPSIKAGQAMVRDYIYSGEDIKFLIQPLNIGEPGKRWALCIGISLKPVRKAVNEAVFKGLGFFGMAMAVAGLLSLFLAKRFVKPVMQLVEGAKAIAEGNFDHRVEIRTGDEIERLGDAFNEMAERVKSSIAEEQKRRKIEEALREISGVLNSTLELKEVLDLILKQLRRLIEYDSACIILLSGDLLKVVASRGYPRIGTTPKSSFPLKEDLLAQQIFSIKRPLVLPHAQEDERLRAMPGTEHIFSWIGAPLMVRGKAIGLLSIDSREPGAYDEETAEIALSFANQAAIAIENARLFRDEARRRQDAEALRQAALALTTTLDRNQVIERILTQLQQVVPYDSASVQLLKGDRLEIIGGRGFPNLEEILGITFPVNGDNPNREVMRTLKPFILEDAPAVYRDFGKEPFVKMPIRSWLGVPMLIGEKPVGMLTLDKCQPGFYTEEHARLAQAFAAQAAIAIENARLFEETRRRARELSILYDVVTAAASSVNLDEILHHALDALHEALKPDDIAILLVEPETGELVIRAWTGFPGGPTLMRRPAGVGIPGWVVQTGEPVLLADVRQDDRYHACDPDTRSELCVPMLVGERVIGALNLESHQLNAFSEDDLRLVSTLAGELAMIIENARLYQEAIEERKRAETLLEETFSGMIVVDRDLRIKTFNPGAEAITGYAADDVLGQPLPEVMGADICEEDSPLREAIETGQRVAPTEMTIAGKRGRRDVLLGITPLSDGYLLTFADITKLKEVDRLKSSMIANVSHEFRAPLASIKAYTELLLEGLDEEDRATRQEFLSIIDHETDRLATLINDFLDLSRLEAGIKIRREPLRLSEVVDDAISPLEVKIKEKDIDLRIDVPADLSLLADRELMVIVAKNLVSNAVKFSHRGGRVEVRGWENESDVFLSVKDEGIGIPKEELPHIFEKFYRVRSTTESGIEGTGLGLVLVKEAVEAHGGTIEVESEPGVGTRFTVRLPKRYEGESEASDR